MTRDTFSLERLGPRVVVVASTLVPSAHFVTGWRLNTGPTYFTIAQLVIVAVAISLFLTRLNAGGGDLRPRATMLPLSLFAAGLFSVIFAGDTWSSFNALLRGPLLLVALVFTFQRIAEEDWASIRDFTVACISLLAAVSLFEAVVGTSILHDLYVSNIFQYNSGGPGFRPPSLVGNPLVLSSLIVVAYSLQLGSTPASSRQIRFRNLALLTLAAAVLASLSRSSLLVLAVVTAFHSQTLRLSTRRIRFSSLLVVVGMLSVAAWLLPRLQIRLLSLDGALLSDPTREAAWRITWEAIADNPILGIGPGQARKELFSNNEGLRALDNQWLTLVVEYGLFQIGMLVTLAIAGVFGKFRFRQRGVWLSVIAMTLTSAVFETFSHEGPATIFALILARSLAGGPRGPKHRGQRSSAGERSKAAIATR